MKREIKFHLLATIVVAMSCLTLIACGDDKEDGLEQTENVSERDPDGTVVVNMNNGSRDNWITIGSIGKIHIDDANNFVGYYSDYEFASVGLVSGLSKIKTIPTSGWSRSVAVVPGTGYVARYGSNYARLYVVDYIVGTTGGIIGATVKYQSPFEVNKNDDDNKQVDYTATTSIKKATIKNEGVGTNTGISFYEDYDVKYILYLQSGKIYLFKWKRDNGVWNSGIEDVNAAGLKNFGECSSINNITKKASWGENSENGAFSIYCVDFVPKGGYACCFTTGSGDKKYMRFYAESYTLGIYGELETVTIQYQLY